MAAVGARLSFKAAMSQVSVPATSANLGSGFDTFGLALDIRDRYAAQILDENEFDVDVSGEGSEDIKKDRSNLVIKAMICGFEHMGSREFSGAKSRGIALRQLNVIPQGRGLGSSAAAIVGGLALARSLVLGGEFLLTNEAMIEIGTELEGHPDNVAAAVMGGATIAWTESEIGRGVGIKVDPRIKAVLFIPESHLATSKARKLLPETIPHRDGVLNASRAALLVHALQERPDLLLAATEDLLHQNYRAEAMPKSMALVNKLRAAGVPAMISGAGPSVLVLHTLDEIEVEEFIKVGTPAFAAQKVAISARGVE
jgi:homoserine kinase